MNRTIVILQIAMLSVTGCSHSVATRDQAPAVLLYDMAHGQQPPPPSLDSIARSLGMELKTSTAVIQMDGLRGIRILYLRAPSEGFSTDESRAVVEFVQGGGSLFLVLDEERRQSLEKTGVNSLIKPFGLTLTPDLEYLHNNGGIATAGEINKAVRELPFSGGRAVEGGAPFAFQLDKDGKPAEAFAAYKRLESGGRIVVMGEGMASLFLGTKTGVRLTGVPRTPGSTDYWGKDSTPFIQEVLAWLAQ